MPYPNTTFPTTIDNPTNPSGTDNTSTFDHAGLHAFENNAIKALETKVGANSSTDNTSMDYKLSSITGGAKALSSDMSNTPDASIFTKGILKLSVAPASSINPIAVGVNDPKVPTINMSTLNTGMLEALTGSYGTPGSSNKFITSTDPVVTSSVLLTGNQTVAGIKTFSSIPVLPNSDPVNANDAARKSYVDTVMTHTTGTLTDGSMSITYHKINKTYFGFVGSNSTPYRFQGGDGLTAQRICTLLGKTLSSEYTNSMYGMAFNNWTGSVWTGSAPSNSLATILQGFSTTT